MGNEIIKDATYEHLCRKDGLIHQTNTPAVIWRNGHWSWWLYSRRHRYYGPQDDYGRWYIHSDRLI